MASAISQKAMLVKLSVKQWTANKLDRKVTQDVAAQFNVNPEVGRYNKLLIPKNALKKIQRACSALRGYYYDNTLPWGDDTSRLLPAANYMNFTQEIRKLRADVDTAVHEFIQEYPGYVQEAQQRLGAMFNADDYPSSAMLMHWYNTTVDVYPVPEADDFRVTLQAEDVDAIRKEIEERNGKATAKAMADLWQRLYDSVQNMFERLSSETGIFRDSLVQNIVDLCELLPRLNVANDPQLELMRQQIEMKLCACTPKELREDKIQRGQVAADAGALLNVISGCIGGHNGDISQQQ